MTDNSRMRDLEARVGKLELRGTTTMQATKVGLEHIAQLIRYLNERDGNADDLSTQTDPVTPSPMEPPA